MAFSTFMYGKGWAARVAVDLESESTFSFPPEQPLLAVTDGVLYL